MVQACSLQFLAAVPVKASRRLSLSKAKAGQNGNACMRAGEEVESGPCPFHLGIMSHEGELSRAY